MGFVTTHPYAALNLLLAMSAGVALAFSPSNQRRPALVSGLLAAPWALTCLILTPSYWQPVYLLVRLGVGMEDVAFMFTSGILSWTLAQCPFERCAGPPDSTASFLRRALGCWGCGSLLFSVFQLAGWRLMWSVLATMVLLSAALVAVRPDLRGVSLRGMVRFAVCYPAILKLVFIASPSFVSHWNRDALLGYYLFGLPVEEILWAAGFGAVWPTILAFAVEPQSESRASSAGREEWLGVGRRHNPIVRPTAREEMNG